MPAFLNILFYPTIFLAIIFLVGCSRDNPLNKADKYEAPIEVSCDLTLFDLENLYDLNLLANIEITNTTLQFEANINGTPVVYNRFYTDIFDYTAEFEHLINATVVTPIPIDRVAFNQSIPGSDAVLERDKPTFGIRDMSALDIRLNGEIIDADKISSTIALIDEPQTVTILVQAKINVLVNEPNADDICLPKREVGLDGQETEKQLTKQLIKTSRYTIDLNRISFDDLSISQLELSNDINVAENEFGHAVSIGNTLESGFIGAAVGVPKANSLFDDGIAEDTGHVYLYEQIDKNDWSDEVLITAAVPDAGDQFGYSVSLSNGFLAVSAPGEDSFGQGIFPWIDIDVTLDEEGDFVTDGINDNLYVEISNVAQSSGAVYLFNKDENEINGWKQFAFIKQPSIKLGLENYDIGFGKKILLKDNILLISAPQQEVLTVIGDDFLITNSGVVFAYKYDTNTASWSLVSTLQSETPNLNDGFGSSLSMHDGAILVGAPGENNGAGGAHLFLPSGNTWEFSAHLTASNSDPGDGFGNAVALNATKIFIAASKEDSHGKGLNRDMENNNLPNSGAVYGFSTNEPGEIEEPWTEFVYVKAETPLEEAQFGYDIKFDGGNLIVAEPFRTNDNSLGHVSFFKLINDQLKQSTLSPYESIENTISIDTPQLNARFGYSLALFKSIFASSANGFTNRESGIDKTHSGKAYIFQ